MRCRHRRRRRRASSSLRFWGPAGPSLLPLVMWDACRVGRPSYCHRGYFGRERRLITCLPRVLLLILLLLLLLLLLLQGQLNVPRRSEDPKQRARSARRVISPRRAGACLSPFAFNFGSPEVKPCEKMPENIAPRRGRPLGGHGNSRKRSRGNDVMQTKLLD